MHRQLDMTMKVKPIVSNSTASNGNSNDMNSDKQKDLASVPADSQRAMSENFCRERYSYRGGQNVLPASSVLPNIQWTQSAEDDDLAVAERVHFLVSEVARTSQPKLDIRI